jgi:hypothetical protein
MPVRVASSYSDALPVSSPTLTLTLAVLFAAEPAPPSTSAPTPIPLAPGRTTTIRLAPDLGVSVERAVPGRAFARAVDMDADQRWSDAAGLYQDAVNEWTNQHRVRPSPALERAIQKAERERQRSTLLASTVAGRGRPEAMPLQVNPLEEGRLLRAKLMVVRAARGLAPPELVARARASFEEASRAGAARHAPFEPEIRLQLCATRAASGDRAGARLERAHLTSAERRDPENALALAVCAAALGEDDEALALLEIYMLRPLPHPIDPYTQRDLYLANDWDRLRGKPRFETLFRSSLPALPP